MISRRCVRRILRFWPLVALLSSALAQTGHYDPFNNFSSPTNTTSGYVSRSGTSLQVTVFADGEKKRLDRQSLVKLSNQTLQMVSWQTTNEVSETGFGDLPFGHYELEVSAVGYLSVHREFQAITANVPIKMEIVLERDPAAVNLEIADAALPPKARKATKHGVSALKSGNLNEASKRLNEAYKLAPSNSDLNFLLGYLYYQKKDLGRASEFLNTSTSLSPGNAQALTLAGRVSLEQDDYSRAVSSLEKAVVANSDYWVAHDLLATSYLKQQQYDKARDQAQIALAKAQGNAPASQLVLGQALVNLGQKQEGIKALQDFVSSSPKNPLVPQVKAMIARIDSTSEPANDSATNPTLAAATSIDPMIAAAEPTFSVRPWQPPSIDENKPSVASGVACPLEGVMQMTSSRVQEFVTDISRIAAIEHLLHEQLDEIGDPITKETRTFNYVASISEPSPGFVAVDEYRQDNLGTADFPDHIASSGFATLALVFHPSLRDNFEMTCEGLGEWHGQPTWLVHFRQRDDRPARIHDYKVGNEVHSLKLKGRAWITADKFQIVRIESELVTAVPQIHLAGEHQVVEYGPVPFTNKNVELWLPKSAEIYLDFRRHRYYRKHSFDHYMLFSVDAQEHRKEPPPPAPNSQN
jgi:tetratricopeptide (TPR) repeat protein